MPFTLAQGTLSVMDDAQLPAGARVVVISTHDGEQLHDGVAVAPDGRFSLVFDEDPTRAWKRRGVEQISFAVRTAVRIGERPGERLETIARGPDGRLAWKLADLPLRRLRLHIAVAGGLAPRAGDDDGRREDDSPDRVRPIAERASIRDRVPPARISRISMNARGEDVEAIQTVLVKLGHAIPVRERDEQLFGVATRDAILRFQARHGLRRTGVVDDATRAALAGAAADAELERPRVEGRILLESGAPAGDVPVRLYSRRFGGEATRLGATTTDEQGYFAIPYDPDARGVRGANLEIRAVDPEGDEVPLSRTRFGADRRESFTLVAPSRVKPPATEFERLAADVREHVDSLDELARAREDDERQDLSLLHRATGWDARLLALASLAARRGEQTGIPKEALYGLFRAGLPEDPSLLARVGADAVKAALTSANEAGIVDLDDDQVAAATAAFEEFALSEMRTSKVPGALSSFRELVDLTALSDRQKTTFERVFFEHRGTPEELWDKVREARISQERVDSARLVGKLASLTRGNAPLVQSLMRDVDSAENLAPLVDEGLYEADAWKKRIKALVRGRARSLGDVIPPAYEGEDADERLDAYAADLARKVRRSFPTRVIARRIETGQLALGERDAPRERVGAFFRKAAELGFVPGRQPLEPFVRDNRDALFERGASEKEVRETVQAVARTTRLYQITPTDEALQALASLDIGSAHDVVGHSREAFVERFGERFQSPEVAERIHEKAEQVSAVALNVVTMASRLASNPGVYALSGPALRLTQAREELVKRFPSLETLFGSLDFCECRHCRSVLSPAAYFVDLLRFLDAEDSPDEPYDALVARRPDLPHLPLTCENTLTALPYIDVVNEVLEFFVVHERLGPEVARDTGSATTPELLAEPQHILPAAYDVLRDDAVYPLTLPFDLWLATVRRFLGQFETPLFEVLDAFRPTDELFAPEDGAAYGRADVFFERLGVSPAERAVLTDPQQLERWFELYGFDSGAESVEALRSARTLARRLGVSYLELADLVRTRFVNPGAHERDAVRLVLDYPEIGCDFSRTTLEYSDGGDATALDFLKLNLFVRLWKKLGWTARELDRALEAFAPGPLTLEGLGAAMRTALVYLAHVEALADRLALGRDARERLVALWSNLPTTGVDPLYARLFLQPSIIKPGVIDPAFDDPDGDYLSDPDVLVQDHLPAIQAALRLTADDVASILAHAGLDPASAPLSLDTVSLLHRHGLLAEGLRIPVRDLITLARLSGIDPFPPLHEQAIETLADDAPYHTLRFVDVVEAVRDSGLEVGDLEYLLLHRDPAGERRAGPEAALPVFAELSAAIRRVRAEHAIPADPAAVTDDQLRQELALVLPPDAVQTFTGLWTGALALDPDQARAFFEKHLQKHVIGGGSTVGFLEPDDFDLLFAPIPDDLSAEDREAVVRQRRATLVTAVLPAVQRALVRQLVVQLVSADLGADASLTEALLTDPRLLAEPGSGGGRLLDAFAAAGERGVSATFFGSQDATGEPLATAVVDTADTGAPSAVGAAIAVSAGAENPARPAGTDSARLAGYLQVPTTGTYRFFVALGAAGAEAELRVEHGPTFTLRGSAAEAGDEISDFVELKAGVPHRFTLEVRGLGDGEAALLVQGEGLAKGGLDRLTLYPAAAVERVRRARILLGKALAVIDALGLSERAVTHISTHSADFGGFSLSQLPTSEAAATEDPARALFDALLAVAAYARLAREIAGGTDDLVAVLEAARQTYPAAIGEDAARAAVLRDVAERLGAITRREPAIASAAIAALGFAAEVEEAGDELRARIPGLATADGLVRLWRVLAIVGRLGVPVEAVARWATPAPDFAVARDLRFTVKARHDADTWRRIARGIFDELRRLQRDALVAYVREYLGFERDEQLFEHFLLDPGMEPVVQTSRIQLAISSVQLFVQRCLLNLEPEVPPSAIDADRWEWMKRYRVWEANRKIFLFPENWLEPELRDDKTHLFQEMEGALLQGDVTRDVVEDAFYRYLKGLEEIARLEIVATCVEEDPYDSDANTLHVIGRTYGLPHRYFYRRHAHAMWTPWEPVTAEIEGDHIAAAMWRGRLHVFWVTFLEGQAGPADDDPSKKIAIALGGSSSGASTGTSFEELAEQEIPASVPRNVDIQLHWSEHYQGQWTTPTVSGFGVVTPVRVEGAFDNDGVFIHVEEESDDGEETVTVHLVGAVRRAIRLVSKHSAPERAAARSPIPPPYEVSGTSHGRASLITASGALWAAYHRRREIEDGESELVLWFREAILREGGQFRLLFPGNTFTIERGEIWSFSRPFFYQDRLNTFFVEPTLSERVVEDSPSFGLAGRVAPLELELHRAITVIPFVPAARVALARRDDAVSDIARFDVRRDDDWITNPAAVLRFDGRPIGSRGGLDPSRAVAGEGSPTRDELVIGDDARVEPIMGRLRVRRPDR